MVETAARTDPDSRRTAKSAAAFRTISEVAGALDVPQHVLRFWETRFTQVRPLKRAGGRRYYRPEDVQLLRRIRELLYSEGYTIKGVQRLLRENAGKPPPRAGDGAPSAGASSSGASAGDPSSPKALAAAKPGTAAVAIVAPAPATGFGAGDRKELEAIAEELRALRDLLHGGG